MWERRRISKRKRQLRDKSASFYSNGRGFIARAARGTWEAHLVRLGETREKHLRKTELWLLSV
jgi:hypothetical protein